MPKDEAIPFRNSNKNPRKSSFELQKDLAYSRVHVSSATMRHRLIKTGRKAKNLTKKQLLTQKMMKKRLAQAKNTSLGLHKPGKSFIF